MRRIMTHVGKQRELRCHCIFIAKRNLMYTCSCKNIRTLRGTRHLRLYTTEKLILTNNVIKAWQKNIARCTFWFKLQPPTNDLLVVLTFRPWIYSYSGWVHAFRASRLDYCGALLFGLPKKAIRRFQLVRNAASVRPNREPTSHLSWSRCTTCWFRMKIPHHRSPQTCSLGMYLAGPSDLELIVHLKHMGTQLLTTLVLV